MLAQQFDDGVGLVEAMLQQHTAAGLEMGAGGGGEMAQVVEAVLAGGQRGQRLETHVATPQMGIGVGNGEHRAIEAAQQAFSSPLLEETSLEGAQRVLVNFVGGPDTTITSWPAATQADANALPILPLEPLVKYRTGSRYCRVGPDVMRMRAMSQARPA